MKKEQHVLIGEIKIGKPGDVLYASLGSCIGIGVIWKKKKIYGLAHCLLPHAVDKVEHPPGRYVEEAIPELMRLMEVAPENKKELEVIIVGGGNMTHKEEGTHPKLIGEMNTEAALAICKKLHLNIVHEDTLGNFGRKISLNCLDNSYEVTRIPRLITK